MKTVSKSASDRRPSPVLLALAVLATGLPAASAQHGSLWPVNRGERAMVADRKAAQVGDILTVVVSESANATSAQTKSSNRDSSIDDAVGRFIFNSATSGLGTHKGGLPATSATGSASYTGGGQVNNSQTLSARAAVLVTDVLPNGNLVIEGVRVVTFSGETQYVILHGLVRADDIGSTNTVFSSNVADARVEFVSEGNLTDAQRRGWLAKLYEKLRLF